jgi:pimeloyl-ACP methyl ester carboxylesterase
MIVEVQYCKLTKGEKTMDGRLILFPGLAADERMYAGITCQCCELMTPRLLIPQPGETMAGYARRHIEALSIEADDIVGGCSFGSLVASEIARQQPCRGLVLLSGAVSSQAMVHQAQQLNRWASWIPYPVIRHVLTRRWFLQRVFGGGTEAELALGRVMIEEAPAQLVREGGRLAVSYFPLQSVPVPVFALHGAEDRVIRSPDVDSLHVLEGAGHGMVVSHRQEVIAFLATYCIAL